MRTPSIQSSRISLQLPPYVQQSSNGEAAAFLRESLAGIPNGSTIKVKLPQTGNPTAIARVLYKNLGRLQIGIED